MPRASTLTLATDAAPAKGRRETPLAIAPDESFVTTPYVESITTRATHYLDAGYPVHLSGPAGTGKTTLAFHVASLRGRPVTLIHGNGGFNGADLVGRDSGYKRSSTVDNYIRSVLKTEESVDVNWTDNPLTTACERGHTLIYDEFNRTRAEANNILLSLLEEGILSVPRPGGGYLKVHPEFRIILTSNPAEYAGVHRAQDALLDRLITIRCGHYDEPTEVDIVRGAAEIDERSAGLIVRLVRCLRGEHGERQQPTVRAAIALARITSQAGATVTVDDPIFSAMAWDILGEAAQDAAEGDEPVTRDEFRGLLEEVIGPPPSEVTVKKAGKAA